MLFFFFEQLHMLFFGVISKLLLNLIFTTKKDYGIKYLFG